MRRTSSRVDRVFQALPETWPTRCARTSATCASPHVTWHRPVESWAAIGPLLAPSRMGRPVRDRQQVVNGILWKLSTGATWRDLPERYGPRTTVYERFRCWSAEGTWDRPLARVQQHRDAVGAVLLDPCVRVLPSGYCISPRRRAGEPLPVR